MYFYLAWLPEMVTFNNLHFICYTTLQFLFYSFFCISCLSLCILRVQGAKVLKRDIHYIFSAYNFLMLLTQNKGIDVN